MNFLELRLPSTHADDQLRFYSETLGLSREGDAVRAGATVLRFEQEPVSSPLHFALNVPENQIGEARDWTAERAPLLADGDEEIIDFSGWNAHAVYFRDPEGNIVELIARHDLPNASTEPFSAASLLEVSEAGVPTSDVAGVVDLLGSELRAPLYDGDRSRFAAVGNPEGLFIVVPVGRPWFPTELAALDAPLEVVVRGANSRVLKLPGTPCRVNVRDR
jgi:catechol 2,3-dioxygenase-like lactoylglutathione lyase family enzyme